MGEDNEIGAVVSLPLFLADMSFCKTIINGELHNIIVNGIVLVTDDVMCANQFADAFCLNLSGGGMRADRWNSKTKRPKNYEAGILILRSYHKIEEVESFLGEKNFLPVVLVGGALPEYLRTGYYLFRLTEADMKYLYSRDFFNRVQSFRNFVIKNVKEICDMLAKIETTTLWNSYVGSELCRNMYKAMLAMAGIEKMFMRESHDEVATEKIHKNYVKICLQRLNQMDEFSTGEDLTTGVAEALVKYLEEHTEIYVEPSERVDAKVIQAAREYRAVLYDDNYYYIAPKLFMAICASFVQSMSETEFKRQLAAKHILKTEAENYAMKKQIRDENGNTVRLRMFWLCKNMLIFEDNLSLEDIFESHIRIDEGKEAVVLNGD